MSLPEITQDNVHIFIPHKVAEIVSDIVADEHISEIDALRKFYYSETYRQLETESTKLWHDGPIALYQYYQQNK